MTYLQLCILKGKKNTLAEECGRLMLMQNSIYVNCIIFIIYKNNYIKYSIIFKYLYLYLHYIYNNIIVNIIV